MWNRSVLHPCRPLCKPDSNSSALGLVRNEREVVLLFPRVLSSISLLDNAPLSLRFVFLLAGRPSIILTQHREALCFPRVDVVHEHATCLRCCPQHFPSDTPHLHFHCYIIGCLMPLMMTLFPSGCISHNAQAPEHGLVSP